MAKAKPKPETASSFLDGKVVLVTGGTGSFGTSFVEAALKTKLTKLIVFSRDELKQFEMRMRFSDERLMFFLGDVRDLSRLQRVFFGVDIVVHAAALKQVPALEYNPMEAVKTNVLGTENVIEAAIDNDVSKMLFISTDKAVNPENLYGSTKLCAEKLVTGANSYRGAKGRTAFSSVRYGNVFGSRGSLFEIIQKQRESGVVFLTHPDMTRFWLRLEDSVQLVMNALGMMRGGEIFVPKVSSMSVKDVITVLAPECRVKVIGMRPGEKLHEMLITDNESYRTRVADACYVVEPDANHEWWDGDHLAIHPFVSGDFVYASNVSKHLTSEEFKRFIRLS